MSRVTVVLTDPDTLKNLYCSMVKVPSMGQNSQPLIGNGDVFKCVKNSRVGPKTPNKEKFMVNF